MDRSWFAVSRNASAHVVENPNTFLACSMVLLAPLVCFAVKTAFAIFLPRVTVFLHTPLMAVLT